jgi:tRNA 2-thiouridine synthesizing protein A
MSVITDIPKAEKTIDARGSFCPGPLLELIRGVKSVPVGAVVVVLSSDPGSNKDIPLWIEKASHEYLGAFPEAGYTQFAVRKAH